MNNNLNKAERKHLQEVKELPCSVCDEPPPSTPTTSSKAGSTPALLQTEPEGSPADDVGIVLIDCYVRPLQFRLA